MSTWAPIRYKGFWDVPRIFIVTYQDRVFLFDCPFDEDTEDYPESYQVYTVACLRDEELAGSWAQLSLKATQYLGEVPINKVRFDPSKRKEIDTAILDELTAKIGTG